MHHDGFTLIEMLFTLSIVVVLSVFTLPYFHSMSYHINNEQFQSQVISFISKAKSHSLVFHKNTRVQFSKQTIRIYEGDFDYTYYLPNQYTVSTSKSIYFNENGNVNQATHIDFTSDDEILRLNVHLGSGDVCFET